MSWHDIGVTFDLGSAKLFSAAIFEIISPKAVQIPIADYLFIFYLIVLFPLTAIFQLIKSSANKFYSFKSVSVQINAVMILL